MCFAHSAVLGHFKEQKLDASAQVSLLPPQALTINSTGKKDFTRTPVQNPDCTRILCKSCAQTPTFFHSSTLHSVNPTRSRAAPATRAPSPQLAGISLVSACYSSTDSRAERGETRSIHDSLAHVVMIPEGRSKRYGMNTNPG